MNILQEAGIAAAAVQEDVDVVGLSILSGAHMELFPRVRAELEKRGMGHVLLVGGGIIPKDDIAELKKLGIAEIFTPGASTKDIVTWIRTNIAPRS